MCKMHLRSLGDMNVLVLFINFTVPFLILLFELLFWNSLKDEAAFFMGLGSNSLVKYTLIIHASRILTD